MFASDSASTAGGTDVWPSLPLEEWRDSQATLHMCAQIVGKTRLALAPMENHWWQVPLYVTSRGLTTTPIPYGTRTFQIDFDFIDHDLTVLVSDGATRHIALRPRAVAEFYAEYAQTLAGLALAVRIWPVPVEVEHPVPFAEDRQHAAYDSAAVNRFWRALVQADRVLKRFRGRFLGKSSPVHFFWGSFDLALTRFSGRRAPVREGADRMMREATSHEEFSAGFWPGSGAVQLPAFYAYAAPEPPGFREASIRPHGAWYSREISNFVLPYENVRTAASPDQLVLDFLQSTYDATAELAGWDRAALDRPETEWP
jgi:hypothetical protein